MWIEEKAEFLEIILKYQNWQEVKPTTWFKFIRPRIRSMFDEDQQKWESRIANARSNWLKWWRPKSSITENNPEKPTGLISNQVGLKITENNPEEPIGFGFGLKKTQNNPEKPVNVNVNVNDNVNVNNKKNIKEKNPPKKEGLSIYNSLSPEDIDLVKWFITYQYKNCVSMTNLIKKTWPIKYLDQSLIEFQKLKNDYSFQVIYNVLNFIIKDSFWKNNIKSIPKLSKKNKDWFKYIDVILDLLTSEDNNDIDRVDFSNCPPVF